jgi:hypothetical protein
LSKALLGLVVLAFGLLNAGSDRVVWDLRDDSGDLVSSGIYVVILEIEGKTLKSKLAVIR